MKKHINCVVTLILAVLSLDSCVIYTIDDLNPVNRPSPSTGIPSSTTANCYIITSSGSYDFPTVKGGSAESVGVVASAEVLWESFGTDVKPSVGDLISSVSYSNGRIQYTVSSPFKKGNAVIAAKDASGEILWSWHIWLTDKPEEQEYYNNAGTMMDRNLGATSATPGDVGALGLLYQWGRKDPFLGSSSIYDEVEVKSTGSWPSAVASSSSEGTIDYATKNPMTFITEDHSNSDWYYTGGDTTDNTRWQSSKTIYDPCPPGWRVPDGGEVDGVWYRACGFSSFIEFYNFYEGVNFSGEFGIASIIWYPASGCRAEDGSLMVVGGNGVWWSVTSFMDWAYEFGFDSGEGSSSLYSKACGCSVRCLKE